MKLDDKKIQFYTGFPNHDTFINCYDLLESAVNHVNYWGNGVSDGSEKSCTGRGRCLPPLEKFFVPARLRLGLFEQDLAHCFGRSVSTVSRICITWIIFYT